MDLIFNNMKIEDIIEGLNRHIEGRRKSFGMGHIQGRLVLQKTIKPHNTFKAYKEYNFTIWFIKGRGRFRVLTLNHVARVIDGHEETLIREMTIRLSEMIFNWIGSNFYEQVIKGEYNGYINEQISDSTD